jgi:hypothetical protein
VAQTERALVDAFLAEMPQWSEWHGHPATILEIGDTEDHLALAVRKGVVTFETVSRGHRYLSAQFPHEGDAWRFLIMRLGESWRPTNWPLINPRALPPGTSVESVSWGHQLRWPRGEATFYSELDATAFSWVAMAEPAVIAASCRHVNGEPLFNLGVKAGSWPPKPRRPRRIKPPAAPETPPPDNLDPRDLAVIDDMVASLGWTRQVPTEGYLLAVEEQYMGRAISYRQSQFVYEKTLPDVPDASAVCAFSTADAARRFLLADLGGILRTRRMLPAIHPKGLAAGCEIEKGPTSILMTSPAGRGSFNVGYVGYQQSLIFSWVASAALTDIAASFRNRDGKPIFDVPPRPVPPRPRTAEGSAYPRPAGIAAAVMDDDDPDLAADLVVIDDFLTKRLFWSRQPGLDPLVIEVADFESQWVLTRGENGYDAEYRHQGSRNVYGTFSSARGARRFVLMDLGRQWRQSQGLKGIGHKQLAPGARLDDRPDGYRLTWAGGEARFLWDYNAVDFSWIATAELADITATFSHANGEPLFDLRT